MSEWKVFDLFIRNFFNFFVQINMNLYEVFITTFLLKNVRNLIFLIWLSKRSVNLFNLTSANKLANLFQGWWPLSRWTYHLKDLKTYFLTLARLRLDQFHVSCAKSKIRWKEVRYFLDLVFFDKLAYLQSYIKNHSLPQRGKFKQLCLSTSGICSCNAIKRHIWYERVCLGTSGVYRETTWYGTIFGGGYREFRGDVTARDNVTICVQIHWAWKPCFHKRESLNLIRVCIKWPRI